MYTNTIANTQSSTFICLHHNETVIYAYAWNSIAKFLVTFVYVFCGAIISFTIHDEIVLIISGVTTNQQGWLWGGGWFPQSEGLAPLWTESLYSAYGEGPKFAPSKISSAPHLPHHFPKSSYATVNNQTILRLSMQTTLSPKQIGNFCLVVPVRSLCIYITLKS